MNDVLLVLYFLFSVIHLYHSWMDDGKRRRLTKPFLMSSLALFYAFSAGDISWALLLALAFSWLGDVLLMPRGHGWFVWGGVCFLISHILFMVVCFTHIRLEAVPWMLIILVAPVYCGASVWVMQKVAPTTPKGLVKPMGAYLLTNSVLNLLALIRMFSLRDLGGVVVYGGALLFFISDCTLFFVRYYREPEVVFKKHFTVMLTYLAGELFITLGILIQ